MVVSAQLKNKKSVISRARSRKSQAAMEFLMTYGWAILVVLAAIAALAYFGVLSPEKFLPEKCLIETGLTCISSKVEAAQSIIVFQNGYGKTVVIDRVDIGKCSNTFNTTLTSEEQSTFILTGCSNGVTKEVFKGDVIIKYTEKSTNLSKTAYGTINTKIE
ncbi:hypothetical protein HY637_03770 [Candidatus Woesearchaeota archaeon]|nr:hypothetical protein [Candidatus Woesearchaeota archaeon]